LVRAYDPVGMEQAKEILADVVYCRDSYDCVEEADAVVIITEWSRSGHLVLNESEI
jgi:UDPglucose 6-dehydrogenase